MAYLVKADIKEYLGKSGTEDDVFIDKLILTCIDEFEKRTGKIFIDPGETNALLHGENNVDGRELLFDTWASGTLSTVTNGDGVVVSSADYTILGDGINNTSPFYGIVLTQDSGLSWVWEDTPEEAISVKADWSFSQDVPKDINDAMIMWVIHRLRTRKEKQATLPVEVNETIKRYSSPFRILYA